MENKENCIEFISGAHYATVSFTNQRHITKIEQLYKDSPEDFKYFHKNSDGSICAKLPMKWIKVSLPRKVSEEQRIAAGERFKKMWEQKDKEC